MSEPKWLVDFQILRQHPGDKPHFKIYPLEVDPEENVLDAIERIWAKKDRTLTFRHACHHSTCGVCGMRVNGVEKLTCITAIKSVTKNGGIVRVEPLRNFTVLSDLVVDMGPFFRHMGETRFNSVAPVGYASLPFEPDPTNSIPLERLVDCIECGLCISACPAATTNAEYSGPAALAAIQLMLTQNFSPDLIALADHDNGAWRCHSAFECSEVCPSNVDPAWRIMNLRRRVVAHRFKSLFKFPKQEKQHA